MMRKMLLVLFLVTFVTAFSFAQLSFGLSAGVGYLLEDTSDLTDAGWDVVQVTSPIMVEGLMFFDQEIEIPGVGASKIGVGGKIGWTHMFTASGEFDTFNARGDIVSAEWEISQSTVPILVYGKAVVDDLFYVGLGLGVHAWNLTVKIDGSADDDFGDNGIDFASLLEPGMILPIGESLNLNFGLQIFSLGYESEDGDESSISFGATVGINYEL